MKFCPKCGAQVSAEATFCQNCGVSLAKENEDEKPKTCPNCGKELVTGAKFCDSCGTELTIRRDDAPEVVLSRLAIYHEQTEPLKAYYEKTGKLKLVIGQTEIADTNALTFETIDGAQTGR